MRTRRLLKSIRIERAISKIADIYAQLVLPWNIKSETVPHSDKKKKALMFGAKHLNRGVEKG